VNGPAQPHDTGHPPGPNLIMVPTDVSQGEAAAPTRAVPARDERPTAICYDTDVAAPAAVTAPPELVPGSAGPIGEGAA
jgi:hypothetical protein